ncbi:hypothetical protein KAR91_49355 [Candidatus Pacearchaeota archaeon]|nr:hypothetical protein [Candidatus Pacearchaeota archaeon]
MGEEVDKIGWLSQKQFAKKFGVSPPTIITWRNKGFLTFDTVNLPNGFKGYIFPDLHPKKHPGYKNKIDKRRKPDKDIKKALKKVIKDPVKRLTPSEKTKERLRPYHEKFIKESDPSKMFFTGAEIVKLLDITASTLYQTWKGEGLKRYKVPEGSKIGGDGARSADWVYTRVGLINFLSGEWDKDDGADEKLIASILGTGEGASDGYYHYDPEAVYPFSGEGVIQWIKDKKLMREDKRQNKWVPIKLWGFQVKFIKEAFKLREDGDYQHNMIVASWERGEGKTNIIMALFLFRFFNRYGEIINLSGLSKDQSSFAHYDLAKKTILNTPMLNSTPGLEVKEKEITLKQGQGDPVCTIKAVPTSTGLLPGTTCAVFTELHKLQDRQFFIDLWTSIRATPNSMILIDTTVAAKGHIVYGLWDSWCKKDDPLLYFNHKQDDIQNPETTPEHLASFRRHMLPFEFNRYFRNRWEDAVGGLFTPASIEKKNYIGIKIDNLIAYGKSDELDKAIEELVDGKGQKNLYHKKGVSDASLDQKIAHERERLIKVDDIYSIPATREDKEKLEALMGGPMTIGLGLDRSKLVGVMPDRTSFVCLGKIQIDFNTAYYFILDIFIPTTPTSMFLQNKLIEWETQYGYIDNVAAEEYQSQDFHLWCEENGYESEFCSPTFKRQEEIFTNLFGIVNDGFFKAPTIPYYVDDEGNLHEGYSNKDDILTEEMGVFLHDGDRRFFGAPDKRKKAAVKDDIIYSLGWAGRACQCESMGEFMKGNDSFVSLLEEPDDLIGEY